MSSVHIILSTLVDRLLHDYYTRPTYIQQNNVDRLFPLPRFRHRNRSAPRSDVILLLLFRLLTLVYLLFFFSSGQRPTLGVTYWLSSGAT